ncbi:MAG: hypothetical protein D6814_01835, partial [Calditrichaeota bacterium]
MKVYFLGRETEEGSLAWHWLKATFPQAQRLTGHQFQSLFPVGENDLLWWHAATWQAFRELEESCIPVLKQFLAQGGRLLLTLQACRAVTDLGLEKHSPDLVVLKRYPEKIEEHAMRGLLSFMHHPLFSPFHGGIYLWQPAEGELVSQCGYSRERGPENGDPIAVDRVYIGNDPTRIFAWEYAQPRVLCIGAYVQFNIADRIYRPARQAFLQRCLEYLSEPLAPVRPVWPKPEIGVQIRKVDAAITPIHVSIQKKAATRPALDATHMAGAFFDLAGERILLMGSLGQDLSEIWVHPFRLCHHVEFFIDNRPLQSLAKAMEVGNEWVEVKGNTKEGDFVLSARVSSHQPTGMIVFHGLGPSQSLQIKFLCDLRLMWNYPVGTPGKLYVTHHPQGIEVHSQNAGLRCGFLAENCQPRIKIEDSSDERESQIRVHFQMTPHSADTPVLFRFWGMYANEEMAGPGTDGQSSLPVSEPAVPD